MKKTEFEKVHLVNPSKHCKVFNIVKRKDKYIITLGRYNVSEEEFESVEDADKYISEKPWDLIICTYMALNDLNKKHDETNTDKN